MTGADILTAVRRIAGAGLVAVGLYFGRGAQQIMMSDFTISDVEELAFYDRLFYGMVVVASVAFLTGVVLMALPGPSRRRGGAASGRRRGGPPAARGSRGSGSPES